MRVSPAAAAAAGFGILSFFSSSWRLIVSRASSRQTLADLGDVDADVARLQTPGVDFAEQLLARQVIVLDRESEAQLVLSRNAQELLLIHKILPEGEKLR